ncbi:protein lingerer-like isoform X3 [Haliotis rubra]|uniref:protein lingerer-like isoform X3 n=1 Tax=Haliotis rubra TaxID=36100 RepID=UPI001EE527E5|nr:protein lingerer-like isoform X3 [Haliotis rubra]
MMSAAVSTSRATSRTSKDKSKATAHQTQTKSDGPPSKVQPTEEQMRIAQITSGQDDADLAAISQLMEMTGKSEDTVAVALHDCENDLERAALMLLEEQDDEPQGEWKVEQSKKKKRTNNASVPIPKTEPVANHVSDKSDSKRDRSRDDDRPDNRHDGPPRRGRRNGGPPPRLARGRGRDRNNQYGERNAEGDNEGFRHRDGFGDRGGKGNYQDGDGFKDHDGYRDQDGFRDKENGFGGFGRERSGDRGRGRGRGNSRFAGRGGRGRGGGGGGGFKSEGRPQRFDKGPQIDTWTNETAENADKEPAGWGETWESAPASEDWNDDTWQGSLTESKVFTASTVKEEPMAPSPLNDITSSMGQSNSLGQSGPMPSSMGQPGPLRQPGSIVTSNSLGQPSTLGQRLDLGTLLKTAEQQQQQANDNLIAQYNQQATESIKNTIGIGSSSRSNLSNLQPQAAPSGLSSYSQNLQQGSSISAQSLAAQQMSSQPPHVQQALQQRPKPQRSKLPPPSKIPASAVEMPGHVMPQLDVQFGVDFGADSSSPFSFGSSDSAVTASSYTTTTQNSAVSMNNHLSQSSKSSESVMSATMMSSPGKQPPAMSGLDHSSPRTSVFQNTAYNTTPPKKDAPSPLSQPTKMTPPEPIPFPPSQSDMKSSPLMGGQRQGQTAASLAQGSLSTVKSDSSSLGSFVQSSGTYQSSSYQGHKSSGLSNTQAYTTSTQGSSFPSQYQPSQNQYQTGQNQYSSGSNQYQSGSNQYPSYQAGAASFQSQTNYSSSQATQNSLYPSSAQTNSYQGQQTGSSYQLRDSQPSSARQSSTNSSNAYQNQASSLSSPPSQTQSASVSGYNSKSYTSSGHQSNLQTSPLTANKLGDTLSNMSIKDSMADTHQSAQFDHTTTSTTAASHPTTTSATSLANVTSTIAATTISSVVSGSTRTSLPSSTKAPPNLPPGVPLLGHQYIVGQSAIPPFYVSNPSQSMQQPLYPGYEDVQLLQQRLPLANSYYDMSGFPVPSTIGGQERATLGSVPYSVAGTTDSSKLNRVDAQSPNPTSQQQSTQSAHHPFINLQYGYYYPSMLPGTGFQYPTVFPMPPVTNTAHAGTTATNQFQKSFGYNTAKGYDDLTQAQDFTKTGYGATQTQAKGAAGTRSATGADLASSAYNKTHTQGFDKQAFHAGTPPPFNLPMATQAGAMGAPTTPYGAAPFVPMMPHQPHSQMLHHPLQQDSTGGSARAQQATSQAKGGTKPYTTYWGSN